jgi:hypothetical protein
VRENEEGKSAQKRTQCLEKNTETVAEIWVEEEEDKVKHDH